MRHAPAVRDEFIGDPARGFLHGGVITTLLDTLGSAAVLARDLPMQATLDLRVDYLRPALAGADLHAEATCYRVTRHVAFVRGSCHQGDPERPVAELTATFVLADHAVRWERSRHEHAGRGHRPDP